VAGETFAVSQCNYGDKLAAVKRIRLHEEANEPGRKSIQRRIHTVLTEVLKMCHVLVMQHPNITDLLGCG
jgi:hypothetical protein